MKNFLLTLWNVIQPKPLLGTIFTCILGVAIVIYLGAPVSFLSFILGFGIVFLLIISGQFLNSYFDRVGTHFSGRMDFRKKKSRQNSDNAETDGISPVVFLMFAITFLAVVAVLVVLLTAVEGKNFSAFIFILLAFIIIIVCSVPPFKLFDTGYGELCEAFFVTNLAPAIIFLIQTGEVHRLLGMMTFPLTLLYLAMLLAFSLPDYATDMKYQYKNLMLRLGWRNGINLHNVLVLSTYLLLGMANIMGLPWRLTWPGLLTLPLGVFQIALMIGITRGGKPNWRLLSFTAITLFLLTTYLLTYALWIN